MRVMVTGAAGFIGSHITSTLVKDGHDVVALDLVAPRAMPALANLTWVQSDIRDAVAVAEAMQDVEVVFHQAAMASVPASFANPAACISVNVEGSATVFQQARLAGVARIVAASTSAIYGDDPTPMKHEGLVPRPQSPYAVSKLAMEQLAQVFAHTYGIEMVALRYFNVYGSGQPAEGGYAALIPAIFKALRAGEPARIYGDGGNTRGFVHVSDVVAANLAAARIPIDSSAAMPVINIAADDVVSVNDVLDAIADALGVEPNAVYLEERPGDIRHSRANIGRAREILGFDPQVEFAAGIREIAHADLDDHAN